MGGVSRARSESVVPNNKVKLAIMTRIKMCLICSIIANIYLAVTLYSEGVGGGREVYMEHGYLAQLGSMRDLLGLRHQYIFRIVDPSGQTRLRCILRPDNVVPYYELRGNANALKYDADSKEIIVNIPDYGLRIKPSPM